MINGWEMSRSEEQLKKLRICRERESENMNRVRGGERGIMGED